MTEPSSWRTQLAGRLLVWSSRRGSALEALAAVMVVAGVLAWLVGFSDVRGAVEMIGGALLAWAIAILLRRTQGP